MEGMETASPGAATAAPTPDERRQRVFGWLDARGIAYTWYEHPEAPTIEAARRYWRDDGSKHCKNLFFRNHKGRANCRSLRSSAWSAGWGCVPVRCRPSG